LPLKELTAKARAQRKKKRSAGRKRAVQQAGDRA
jgi:hypothetical protein